MKRLKAFLYSLLLFLISFSAFAADQQPPKPIDTCKVQVPYGAPSVSSGHPVICRSAYLLEHDPVAKIPNWVAWTLTPEHSIGCVPRSNAFATDQSLPKDQRSTPADYAGSGYDQGHLANAADMLWDAHVGDESFYMSNMSPQLPSVNRGTWKNLESAERAWAYQTKHSFTIIAGNIYSSSSKTIGPDKVVVPDFLFKLVTDNTTKNTYAFLFPHKDGLDSDFTKYQVTVADVEKASGITFYVPDSKTTKNQVPVIDLKTLADDKKNKCKGAQ
jgi:endonuclease G